MDTPVLNRSLEDGLGLGNVFAIWYHAGSRMRLHVPVGNHSSLYFCYKLLLFFKVQLQGLVQE
jgi:hypothetical protein